MKNTAEHNFPISMRATFHVALLALFCILMPNLAGASDVTINSVDGKLRIPGYWFTARGTDKLPAIIALHGCDGTQDKSGHVAAHFVQEATFFNAEQMHFLVIDSFVARGQNSICDIPDSRRTIFEPDRREDVFAAIRWLSEQPNVDAKRIGVIGWSHGAQTVLSVIDRTDKYVKAQPIQPRAAVAYYAGCARFANQWDYEVSTPLLMMIGELDNWTPAAACTRLYERVMRGQKDAVIQYHIFPGSYHAFNSMIPVRTVTNAANTKTGSATAGANPEAREASHRMMFEFLSKQFGQPLLLTHEQRLSLVGHRYIKPADTGFARIDDVSAVPVKPEGQPRYAYYLGLPKPKAFVVTEKGGWFFDSQNTFAMSSIFTGCIKAKVKCWLYAVDDTVVWSNDVESRYTQERLQSR